jgi:DtxR family Mn-dependent transcriptional regulator
MDMSISIENFVKIIYTQEKHPEPDTKLSTVAGLLNISKAAATDMARKLDAKKLVYYTKYKPLTLTPKGNELALEMIRKHRLWETFLYKTLNLSLHEIHRAAEHLEHSTSDFLANKIDDYLGHPAIDPHGDPIPDKKGQVSVGKNSIVLSMATSGTDYMVIRLFGSGEVFFDFCASNQIEPGAKIKVEKQYDSGKMTEITVNKRVIVINKEISNYIYVQKNNINQENKCQ